MKNLPVPPGPDGKERHVGELTIGEFSERLLDVVDEDTNGTLEWEEFWILYREFFTSNEAKKGSNQTMNLCVVLLIFWGFLMALVIALTYVDFDGDGKPFLTIEFDTDALVQKGEL